MSENVPTKLENAIVVIGSPRSGTTLLGNLLGAHPALAHLVEPRLTWKYGNDAKSDMLRPEDARPEVCQHIRNSFEKSVIEQGRQRLLEKTPSNALRMEFVERVLPNCKFIHIIRNGVDSVLSIQKYWQGHARGIPKGKISERLREINLRRAPHYAKELMRRVLPASFAGVVGHAVWGPRLPGIEGLLKELSVLEVSCLQWRMSVESACFYGRQLPADRYLECRLEAMSPDLIASVLNYCDLSVTDEVRDKFEEHFDTQLTTKRVSSATPEELEVINKWIGPTRQWLGQVLPAESKST